MTVLHHYDYGDPQGPLLLAVHGVTGHGRRWERTATQRWADRHVVAVDLQGHGLSTWLPPWSLEQAVDDLIDTLDALGPAAAGPVDVVAHSWGGVIALALLARTPLRLRRLVLLDPAFELDPAAGFERAAEAAAFTGYASVDEAMVARNEGLAGDGIHPAVPVELEQHLERGSDGRYRFRFAVPAAVTIYGEVCRPLPAAVSPVPTLVVKATRAPFVTDRVVERLGALLGDDLTVAPLDSGHMVYWERFEETAQLVHDFLA